MLRFRHALVEVVTASACTGRRAAGTAAEVAATAAFAASTEQDYVAGYHLGHVLFLPRGLVVPRASLQSSLDVDLAALLEVFAGDLGQALPEHHIVPLGAVLPFATLVLKALVGGDGQLGDRGAAGGVLD